MSNIRNAYSHVQSNEDTTGVGAEETVTFPYYSYSWTLTNDDGANPLTVRFTTNEDVVTIQAGESHEIDRRAKQILVHGLTNAVPYRFRGLG